MIKYPFADDIRVTIQQAVDDVDSQVGHAYIIRVRVDEGYRDSTTPVFNNGAFFPGKKVPGILYLCHTAPLSSQWTVRVVYHTWIK